MESVESIKTIELINRILDYLSRWNPLYALIFLVGIHTALRVSDLLLLRVSDVRGSHLVVRMKKTGKVVRIMISARLRRALDPHIATLDDKDFLFRSREGFNKPLTRGRVYQVLRQAAAACGLKHIGCHSMRKTFGWFFYKETGDVAALMELLGHEDPAVTLRYIGIVDANIDQVMKNFSIE